MSNFFKRTESNMKIGTHNSMTYLPPKKWWMCPFNFIAKCQSLSIEEQYKLGARMFDIRVSYDKNGKIELRHGLITYDGDICSILKYLNSRKKSDGQIYVRLILEINNSKEALRQIPLFLQHCEKFEAKYKKLLFFCARSKYNWKQLYKFKTDDIDIVQKVSSMDDNKLNDIWPWLYAKKNNTKSFRNRDNDKWLLLDFIETIKDELG